MKKLSRIAALLAAGAALLMVGAGFVSCSEDDGEEDNSPKLTISADTAVSVEAGEAIDVVITAALKNDSFNGPIGKGDDLDGFVTVIPSSLTSFEDNLLIEADEAIADGATSAKVRLTVTTSSEAVSGTIKVTIDGAALKSGKALTSNSLSYTIAGENGGGDSEVVAKTYNFVGLTFADCGSVLTSSDKSAALTESEWTAATTSTKIYVKKDGATLADATVFGGSGHFQLHVASSASVDLTFNGGVDNSFGVSAGGTIANSVYDRYISVPVSAAGTISVTYAANKSGNATSDAGEVAIIDQDGKVLAIAGSIPLQTGGSASTLEATVSSTTTAATVVFSRGGAGAGGLKVYNIAYAPSAE